MENIIVDEYTSIGLKTINLNAELKEAHQMMNENGIRHLPVMDGKKIVGIISERDLLANYGKPWSEFMRVKSVMCTSILFAYSNDSLGDVAYRLSNEKKGSAIILNQRDEVHGIFTTTDALNALVELMLPKK